MYNHNDHTPTQQVVSDDIRSLLYNLGLKKFRIHRSFDHFDFTKGKRLILVIGPMGCGKTEFAARIIRDATIALHKSNSVKEHTTTRYGADRRKVFVVRNTLDTVRFRNNPHNALSYRGGYIECGNSIGEIKDSFGLEQLVAKNPQYGTWIIDEASFYDERTAFVINNLVHNRELAIICPTLSLNFRRTLFNNTSKLLLDSATDMFPLTAYCEHPDCLANATFSYRYYLRRIDDTTQQELPALFFDPLMLPGGDEVREGATAPNYAARCLDHHYMPGMEYTFTTLKPLAMRANNGDTTSLEQEISSLHNAPQQSKLYRSIIESSGTEQDTDALLRATEIPYLAERALIYLFAEANLLKEEYLIHLIDRLQLHKGYISDILTINNRALVLATSD